MKKTFAIVILAYSLILSCKTKTTSLPDQLKTSLVSHLKKIDSLAVLDSVHILYDVPLTEKLGRIIDDSVYSFLIRSAQTKLLVAKENNDTKGIEKYQDELNYMNKVLDSVSNSISSGDTTRKYGHMIGVSYSITKNQITKIDSAVFFIDSVSNIIHPTLIDFFLENALKK
jgi:hypothetical protein